MYRLYSRGPNPDPSGTLCSNHKREARLYPSLTLFRCDATVTLVHMNSRFGNRGLCCTVLVAFE